MMCSQCPRVAFLLIEAKRQNNQESLGSSVAEGVCQAISVAELTRFEYKKMLDVGHLLFLTLLIVNLKYVFAYRMAGHGFFVSSQSMVAVGCIMNHPLGT